MADGGGGFGDMSDRKLMFRLSSLPEGDAFRLHSMTVGKPMLRHPGCVLEGAGTEAIP